MTNAEAWCTNSLHPRKPEGSLGRTAQEGHLNSHTAPELWRHARIALIFIYALKFGNMFLDKHTRTANKTDSRHDETVTGSTEQDKDTDKQTCVFLSDVWSRTGKVIMRESVWLHAWTQKECADQIYTLWWFLFCFSFASFVCLWMNEWMNENLYIAHKKLPHKTLRVHSASVCDGYCFLLVFFVCELTLQFPTMG